MQSAYMTIQQMLKNSAEKYGSLPALQMKDDSGKYRVFSYSQFYDSVLKIGDHLIKSDVKKGDRVALLCENRPEWPIAYFGIVNIGAVVVPFDPKLESSEILNLLLDSESGIIFVSGDLSEKIEKIKSDLPKLKKIVNIDDSFKQIFSSALRPISWTAYPIYLDDIASIIYTSGTTGKPKGVMLTHKNIMSNVAEIDPIFYMIGPGDNFLSVLPAYHTFETTAGTFCPLFKGAVITYAESLKSYNLLKNMQETKATIMCGVPLLYNLFLDGINRQIEEKGMAAKVLFGALFAISRFFKMFFRMNVGKLLFKMVHDKFGGHIKFFVSGGAAIDPEVIKAFDLMGFTILQGYGLTETSPILTACTLDNNIFGSVGKPLPGIEIKISNVNDDGIGEIIARGPNIMKGYYKNPQATSEVIKEGWFYTGDLGKFDADGNLYITGRCKDVIVLGSGVNVYPDEVEFILSKSRFIKEVCVFGKVITEGVRKGMEEVSAAIVPDMDYFSSWAGSGKIITDDLISVTLGNEIERLGQNLTEYKRVAKYYVSKEELPKTATRKIKRFMVREVFGKE